MAYEVFSHLATTEPTRYNDKRVVRVLFVATDGCVNRYDTKYPSKEAHMQAALGLLRSLPNLVVLAVGIGSHLCTDEIRQIAGCAPASTNEPCPNAKFTNFEQLLADIPKYIEEVCDQAVEIVEEIQTEDEALAECCMCPGAEIPGEKAEEKEEGTNNAGVIAGGKMASCTSLAQQNRKLLATQNRRPLR